MKALAIVLLSLLIVLDVKADYSMAPFIDYMQEKGYYDILVQVKFYYGVDIAIDLCKQFVASNDCDPLVRTYFPSGTRKDNEEMKTLENIIFNPVNYKVYNNQTLDIHNWIEDTKQKYNIDY